MKPIVVVVKMLESFADIALAPIAGASTEELIEAIEQSPNDELVSQRKLCVCLRQFAYPILYFVIDNPEVIKNKLNDPRCIDSLPDELPFASHKQIYQDLSGLSDSDEDLTVAVKSCTPDTNVSEKLYQSVKDNKPKEFKSIVTKNEVNTVKLGRWSSLLTYLYDTHTICNNIQFSEKAHNASANYLLSVMPRVMNIVDSEGNVDYNRFLDFMLSATLSIYENLLNNNFSYKVKKFCESLQRTPCLKYVEDLQIEALQFEEDVLKKLGAGHKLAKSLDSAEDSSHELINSLNMFIEDNFEFVKESRSSFFDKYRKGLVDFVSSINSTISLYSFAALFYPVKYGRGKGNSDQIKPGKHLEKIKWKIEPTDIEGVVERLKDAKYFPHLRNIPDVDPKSLEPARRLKHLSELSADKNYSWIKDFIDSYWPYDPKQDFNGKLNPKK